MHIRDMLAEEHEYPLSVEIAHRFGHRSVVVTPLFRVGKPFGTILLRRHEVRLFNETKEALDQQRASGEVLAAVSSSIADTSSVFDTIIEKCQHLFAGET